jgi:hypothetical protein
VQSVVLAAAWLVPGLGHLLLRRWQRALVFFFAVGALGMIGLRLGGYVFSSNAGDFFEWLGYFADVGAGGFYLYAQHWWRGAPDISRAAGDVGTRFLATAGVLNFLCMLDVVDIFRGRKK